jgi:hypothetical protein
MGALIPLSGKMGVGKFAIVDDEDYCFVCDKAWWLNNCHGKYYPSARIGDKLISLHRFIMQAQKGQIIDHINGDLLDNRKCNLRFCTTLQNRFNRGPQKNNKTGFKGVFVRKNGSCFAVIKHMKVMWLGKFPNIIEAAKAYDDAALKYFGEFAWLNFPQGKQCSNSK